MSIANNAWHKEQGQRKLAQLLVRMVRGEIDAEARGIETLPELDEVIAFIARGKVLESAIQYGVDEFDEMRPGIKTRRITDVESRLKNALKGDS